MSAQHTPGPWVVDYGVTRVEVFQEGGRMIAIIPRDDKYGRPFDETKANVCLIAAAPELLAALRLMVAAHAGRASLGAALDEAQAAIAQATGGTQP